MQSTYSAQWLTIYHSGALYFEFSSFKVSRWLDPCALFFYHRDEVMELESAKLKLVVHLIPHSLVVYKLDQNFVQGRLAHGEDWCCKWLGF